MTDWCPDFASAEYLQGWNAGKRGEPIANCPYPFSTKRVHWMQGYRDAQAEAGDQ